MAIGSMLRIPHGICIFLWHNKIIIGGWSAFELPNKLLCNWLRSCDLWLKINTPNIDVLYVLRFGVACSFYKLFPRMEYLQCSEALQIEKSSINMVIQNVFMKSTLFLKPSSMTTLGWFLLNHGRFQKALWSSFNS